MRIARNTAPTADELLRDIERAASGRGVEGRVCGAHCDVRCGRCGASGCQCACSPYCADAPAMLTSDERFPVEPLIAPLVYALKRSGCFEPCWSCEGHADAAGAMIKAPTVWFYAAPASLRLLAAGLPGLRLRARWRVAVTHSDSDNPAPTFALEPEQAGVTLAQLQADVATIAIALPDMLRDGARALLGDLRRAR